MSGDLGFCVLKAGEWCGGQGLLRRPPTLGLVINLETSQRCVVGVLSVDESNLGDSIDCTITALVLVAYSARRRYDERGTVIIRMLNCTGSDRRLIMCLGECIPAAGDNEYLIERGAEIYTVDSISSALGRY